MSEDGTRAAASADRVWFVTRDGVRVSGELPDENSCHTWILRHQSQSTDWAMRYAGYGIESEEISAPEVSERARWVTEQVALWIANDSVWLRQWAVTRTDKWDARELRIFLTKVLSNARQPSTAWQVAQRLSPDDYRRIHWDDVLREISGMGL